MKRCAHAMPFGAQLLASGGARFRLWAPSAMGVELQLELQPSRLLPMLPVGGGWHECHVLDAQAGMRYAFRIDGGMLVPDPASRCNPDDAHGCSVLVDPSAFAWSDGAWRGRPWHEAVIYELHIGAFTPQGTFAAAIDRLDDLVKLGITAIELMPVADFPGLRNWGYDGVLWFAPDSSYGSPDDLRRLVDAAHARGLMVLLDVVYNHFGPDGNYLHVYARPFFNPDHHTPWGAAINFDAEGSRVVRDFAIHNALYWFEEFHVDGLRLDAIHAVSDTSQPDIIEELSRAVHEGPGRERHVHLVLENDLNQARYLARDEHGRARFATAQWNDDVHHAAHVLATGERSGYYADYAAGPLRHFGRALAEGFAYQGEPSAYRGGAARGEPCTHLPPAAFVTFLQTHDQVGNRALGERIAHLADPAPLRALLACVLLAPAVPMLFMGEEFAATTPFLYFCDFQGDLAKAVTKGRREEFARFPSFADPAWRDRIPDPNDVTTFERSKLDWGERERGGHATWLALYSELLKLRRERLLPQLRGARSGSFDVDNGRLTVRWPLARGELHLLANLSDTARPARHPLRGVLVYTNHRTGTTLPPWSVQVSLDVTHV